jgi:chromosome segregation ATPase
MNRAGPVCCALASKLKGQRLQRIFQIGKTMIDSRKNEIAAILSQIENLQRERANLATDLLCLEDESPEAIAVAYRQQARETAAVAVEVKGIDDAIAALKRKLSQKQSELKRRDGQNPLAVQVEESRELARVHAQRINELANELSEEVKALKAIADDISPSYWQVYYKPFITGFTSISVPHVRSDGDVWMIINRVI